MAVNMSRGPPLTTLLLMAAPLAITLFAVGMLPLFFVFPSQSHSLEPIYELFADSLWGYRRLGSLVRVTTLLRTKLGITIPTYVPSIHFASAQSKSVYSRGISEGVIKASEAGALPGRDHFTATTIEISPAYNVLRYPRLQTETGSRSRFRISPWDRFCTRYLMDLFWGRPSFGCRPQYLTLVVFAALVAQKGIATLGVRAMINFSNRMTYNPDCTCPGGLFNGGRDESYRLQKVALRIQPLSSLVGLGYSWTALHSTEKISVSEESARTI